MVVSGRSRCSARWMDPSYLITEVGCWSGGAQVGRTTAGAPILASDQLPVSGWPRRWASYPRALRRGGQVTICHIRSEDSEARSGEMRTTRVFEKKNLSE
ncbi:hypothetical protein BHE74_00045262 [Ensete ventricosum]|nr:hypothetical protein BHE74_00045262 [Ensete ventricosum]